MGRLGMSLVLALAGCGGEAAVQPGPSTARLQLPDVGRAVRYTMEFELLWEKQSFDVVEVDGTSVRLRDGLCAEDDSGFLVDWQTVKFWEDVGRAHGDDRYLGLPPGMGYGHDEWSSTED